MSKRGLFSRRLSNKLSNQISQCIDSEQWNRVIGLAQSKPELCGKFTERSGFFEGIRDASVLPIHEACANESVPLNVVRELVKAYPESVRVTESAYYRLPLSIVCRKTANVEVVEYLLQGAFALKETMLIFVHPDLLYLITTRIVSEYPDAALEPDALGRLPL
jgi:hypothetical protein